jgi:HK97 gp10 family phage protein
MKGGLDVSFSYTVDQAALNNLTRSPTGPVGGYVYDTGAKALTKVRSAAPVLTGALRGSLSQRNGTDRGEPVAELVVAAPHWRYVEYGTRYMRPQPFMRQALRP